MSVYRDAYVRAVRKYWNNDVSGGNVYYSWLTYTFIVLCGKFSIALHFGQSCILCIYRGRRRVYIALVYVHMNVASWNK